MNHGTNASSPSTTWRMGQGSAQTFYPATAGVLRVTSGRAWATLSPSPLKAQPRWSAETDPRGHLCGTRQCIAFAGPPEGSH